MLWDKSCRACQKYCSSLEKLPILRVVPSFICAISQLVSSSKWYKGVDRPLCSSNFAPQRSLTQICLTKRGKLQLMQSNEWGGVTEGVNVRELTFLGACVSCGCCTPKQEGWSPHPQEPETDTWDQIMNQKLFDFQVIFRAIFSIETTGFFFSIQSKSTIYWWKRALTSQ